MLGVLGFLGGMFAWLMWILAPRLNHLRQAGDIFYECVGVVSGDELLLRDIRDRSGETIAVKVRGIQAPPLELGPEAERFAALLNIPTERIPELGKISRSCLVPWLNKQNNIQLDYDRAHPERDSKGRMVARVSLSFIDVGTMQLREGQAAISNETNPYAEIYRQAENKARSQNIGIWRP